MGDQSLTRQNTRAGWPQKDPKHRKDKGKETVEQSIIMNGHSPGGVTREMCWVGPHICDICCYFTAVKYKLFPKMRQNVSWLQEWVGDCIYDSLIHAYIHMQNLQSRFHSSHWNILEIKIKDSSDKKLDFPSVCFNIYIYHSFSPIFLQMRRIIRSIVLPWWTSFFLLLSLLFLLIVHLKLLFLLDSTIRHYRHRVMYQYTFNNVFFFLFLHYSELNSKLQDTLEQIEVWVSLLYLLFLFESNIL